MLKLVLCGCLTVNVGEDCPVFDGLFDFCQLSAGGSVGKFLNCNSKIYRFCIIPSAVLADFEFPLFLSSSRCSEVEQAGDGHRNQLGRRSASRQEVGGLGVLLRQ